MFCSYICGTNIQCTFGPDYRQQTDYYTVYTFCYMTIMSYLPPGYMSLMSYAPMSQVIIELNLYRAYLVPSKTKRFLFIILHKYDTTKLRHLYSNLVFQIFNLQSRIFALKGQRMVFHGKNNLLGGSSALDEGVVLTPSEKWINSFSW